MHGARRGSLRAGRDLVARPLDELSRLLRRIDGAGYGRYKQLRRAWELAGCRLEVERVQPDPFAPPSRMAVRVPAEVARLPTELWSTATRRCALADFLCRGAARRLAKTPFAVDAGRQEVLERSACEMREGAVTLRLGIKLPGRGRRIDGRAAERLLCDQLPEAVAGSLRWSALDADAARGFVACVEDSDHLRRRLPELGLIAFVADGAVLPRRSGVDDRPLAAGAVPFSSPPSLRVEVELPNRGRVAGMGLPDGVTLIVGGGFHGKSTLLRALEYGPYDHVPGDGRELVVCRSSTAKIRAEDGRAVIRVDVSAFVGELPTGTDTSDFSTANASGSTSQATNIVEALEVGAEVLLVDEDTAATNLMIRDARMQELVAREAEPLTPFVDLVRPLHHEHGVSTVLVMGGAGDYLDVADRVVMMHAFHAEDVTERAGEVAAGRPGRRPEAESFPPVRHRVPDPASIDPSRRGHERIRGRGRRTLEFGHSSVDLIAVEQIVDPSQVTGIGLALARLADRGHLDGERTLAEGLARLEEQLERDGLDAVRAGYPGDVVRPRPLEVAAALNRLRALRVKRFA